jgi:hypothetical protein
VVSTSTGGVGTDQAPASPPTTTATLYEKRPCATWVSVTVSAPETTRLVWKLPPSVLPRATT